MGELVPYGQRQAEIAKLTAASSSGMLVGAALGGILTDLFSWRAIFIVDASLAAVLVAPLWRARDAVPARGRQPSQHLAILRDRHALAIYALAAVEGFAFFGGNSYLGALLHDEHGLSYAWTGAVLAVEAVAAVTRPGSSAGWPGAGRRAARCARRRADDGGRLPGRGGGARLAAGRARRGPDRRRLPDPPLRTPDARHRDRARGTRHGRSRSSCSPCSPAVRSAPRCSGSCSTRAGSRRRSAWPVSC